MAATTTAPGTPEQFTNSHVSAKLAKGPGRIGITGFLIALVIGLIYAASQLISDLQVVHSPSIFPYVVLGIALLIALAFEFVNGFHDTANAVATVIYTHSLEPHAAVAWSGLWNFIGVLVSTGAVAFGIVSLLPVELILQVGGHAGFAMVFALLTAAIIWNLGTWWLGLPSSSSHTLIGSIIGVGIANQILAPKRGTSGVDWAQAGHVGKSLLISPLVGFACAALLLLLMKRVIPDKRLYEAPVGEAPPPFWIRCLLILTCTGVSFAHGSNDGQKGMGLIMLILIGTVPTAYALNHSVTAQQSIDFVAVSAQASEVLGHYSTDAVVADPRGEVTRYLQTRELAPVTIPAVREIMKEAADEVASYKELKNVPPEKTRNVRNDMYLTSEALRFIDKAGTPKLSEADAAVVKNYKKHLDDSTKFIPGWVKVAVAIALGLGTMIGWKRIVVTVGEKIGKDHLTYGQGAAAEITAMFTIGAAD
jgi:inorganic phosphate transporter, PiT family